MENPSVGTEQEKPQETKPQTTYRCLVLTLIRHGEARSNVEGLEAGDDSDLTEYGRDQVEALGKRWANVRIDQLLSSQLVRARDTAQAISKHNVGHPEVFEMTQLEERRSGTRWTYWGLVCDYSKEWGGETNEMVFERAQRVVEFLLLHAGKHTTEDPENLSEEQWESDDLEPGKNLPPDLPHVVVVSHNHFMCELWERLLYWGQERGRMTDIDWKNAQMHRIVLWRVNDESPYPGQVRFKPL